jgi:hypothetical protein
MLDLNFEIGIRIQNVKRGNHCHDEVVLDAF